MKQRYNFLASAFGTICLNIFLMLQVQASDSPPVVAHLIDSVVVTENAPATVIDLSSTFTDPEGYLIILKIIDNTNSALVTPTLSDNKLTLVYNPNQTGTATITIQASADGETATTSFKITVTPAVPIPVFGSLGLLVSILGLLWWGTWQREE